VKSRVFRGRLALADQLGAPPGSDPGRPPLHLAGSPGTETAPAASEPTAPHPTRSSSSVPDLHDRKPQG
jgi:hypothetical protein